MSIRSINGGGSVASDVSHSTELIPSGGVVQSNGLGSLADELADAWDEDEEEQEDGDMSMNISRMDDDDEGGRGADGMDERDEEVWMNGTQSSPPAVEVKSRKRRAQQRRGSSFDDEEMEQKDAYRISPALDARLVEIERLARRGMDFVRESDDSKEGEKKHGGGVMNRMIHALRELGGQAGLEGATTRLVQFPFASSILSSFSYMLKTSSHRAPPMRLSYRR
ncbi:MAG: delta subunit of the central stalk of mitochondrial F1F0 ATP synthase, atp16 [Watsoniomyces obsoletus]|nr:MAG: delta subunit of the central stalk of mitochondrial F1F0 ATP synthase, atp16 [Watsoniomyces obsoletus]